MAGKLKCQQRIGKAVRLGGRKTIDQRAQHAQVDIGVVDDEHSLVHGSCLSGVWFKNRHTLPGCKHNFLRIALCIADQSNARWRPAQAHKSAPPSTMGTHSHWPMLMPSDSSPRCASGSRKNSAIKRNTP